MGRFGLIGLSLKPWGLFIRMDVPDIYEALGSGDAVLPVEAYRGLAMLGDPDRVLHIERRHVGNLLVTCMDDDDTFFGEDSFSRNMYFGKNDGEC